MKRKARKLALHKETIHPLGTVVPAFGGLATEDRTCTVNCTQDRSCTCTQDRSCGCTLAPVC
jgi:hypothetical protein